ncbi:hypothetical protein [Massilia sp. METH4]|uniref:hypothetical protein n=1 Tax=Massilia sp. METH4 TaxID=3123041 RepID=UPI0030D3C134
MQIIQRSSTAGISKDTSGSTTGLDQAGLAGAAQGKTSANGPAPGAPAAPPTQAAPVRRGLSNWDQPLQNDISSAQQAVDFLEQTAAQLRSLKTDLAAKLASRQMRDGQLEQQVRQFADTWRNRREVSGGSLDAQLKYSGSEPSSQRFTVRGMSLANLRNGARETLAISVGGGAQGLRSVHLSPGLSDKEIVNRFDQALGPVGVRVSANENGDLVFATDEANWPGVRDAIAVQGSGIRFPTGQLSRLKAEPEQPAVMPENWGVEDIESMRDTLQQVMQALSHVEQALAKVRGELNTATQRAERSMPDIEVAGVEDLATRFARIANEPGYQSLLALTSALVGINRDRVVSLLSLR